MGRFIGFDASEEDGLRGSGRSVSALAPEDVHQCSTFNHVCAILG